MSAESLPSCRDLLNEIVGIMEIKSSIQGRGFYDEAVFRGLRDGWLRDALERLEQPENEGAEP